MFDTIINIIQWGHFIGLLVLIVLYFTTPYILRKYVFTFDEKGNEEGDIDENKEKYDLTSSVEDKLTEENEEEK